MASTDRIRKLFGFSIGLASLVRWFSSFPSLQNNMASEGFGNFESALLAIVFRLGVVLLAEFAFTQGVGSWSRAASLAGCLLLGFASGPNIIHADTGVLSSPIIIDLLIVTLIGIRHRLKRETKSENRKTTLCPINLIVLISKYTLIQFNTSFLFIPRPRNAEDREIETWLDVLRAEKITRGEWLIPASQAPQFPKGACPSLSRPDIQHYDVIRLDESGLQAFLKRFEKLHKVTP